MFFNLFFSLSLTELFVFRTGTTHLFFLKPLNKLEQLSLYQNQLTDLPKEFKYLTNLQKLNLGWNNFKAIPNFLSEMDSLHWVGIFGNPIEDLSPLLPRREFYENMDILTVKRSKKIFEAN